MSYKGRSYPHPDSILPANKFISIAIPTYCRPFYLRKLLETLGQHADMLYEVIVHDDGSPQELQDEVYHMRDKMSVVSFNTGLNQGLPAAANHAIERASSDYVLFMNDDCFFIDKCLQDVCNVLSNKYVGIVSPCNDIGGLRDVDGVCNTNGTRWALSNFLGGGSSFAIRKEVWKEVGGWDERSTSGQSDNVFLYKILQAGYWKAVMEGPQRIRVGNFVYGDDYKPTQPFSKGNDCSVPKLFGLSHKRQQSLSWRRREACQYWVDGERHIDEGNGRDFYDDRPNPDRPLTINDKKDHVGLNDIPFWSNHFLDMFGSKHCHVPKDIDWEKAKVFGHDRWMEQIKKDFGIQ